MMINKTPYLVSICIPTYNGEKYLKETLLCVEKQTYPNIEVIISDDNSKDDTLLLCEQFKNRVNFPVYIFKHQPSGIGANWNNTIRKANGKYIKFLFQDDLMADDCVNQMVSIIEQYPKAKLVASKRDFVIEDRELNKVEVNKWLQIYGDLQKQIEPNHSINHYIISKKVLAREDFFNVPKNKIGEPSAVLFRKDLIKTIGYFNENLKQILDYEYWYRVLLKYDIVIINDKLVTFRIHSTQETNINKNRKISDYDYYENFQLTKLLPYISPKRRNFLLKKKFPLLDKIYKLFC